MRPGQLAAAGILSIALAWAPSRAAATDIRAAKAPAELDDRALKIGSRTLRLPPGRWRLMQRDMFLTPSRGDHQDVDVYGAWAVWLDDDAEPRMIVHLTLPLSDAPRLRRWDVDPCTKNPNQLRHRLTSGHQENECLEVLAVPDLFARLGGDGSLIAHWLATRRGRGLESAVEIVYAVRSDTSYARMELFLPAATFESDDDASTWANAMGDAVLPLFAGKVDSVLLPAPQDRAAPPP